MRTRVHRSLVSAVMVLLLAGCGADTDAASGATPQDSPAVEASQHQSPRLPPPRADSVLYFISDIDGDGAVSYEIQNGSRIRFWHGLDFEAGGTRYYTGFAWITPKKYGADRESGRIDPEAKVTLAHATFVASAPGTTSPWTLQGSEPWIGEFGQAERGNEIDGSREPQTWTTPSGRFLLLQPSRVPGAQGDTPAFEALVFNPNEPEGIEDRKWRHLGTLPAAALEVVPVDGADLPVLRQGAAGGDNAVEYRYDPDAHTYRPTSR